MELKNKKMLFLGDSITFGVGSSDPSKIYWQLLASRDGVKAQGYGISGSRIAKQHNPQNPDQKDHYFASRLEVMDAEADVVVVFGGTNDHAHGDAALGTMADRTPDTFYGAVHDLCIQLINKYPSAQIVFMTPLHRHRENNPYNDWGVRNVGNLETYVDAIKQVTAYYGLPTLDLYRVGGMQPENEVNKKLYLPDGVHPSDAGQEVIYSRLRNFLLNL